MQELFCSRDKSEIQVASLGLPILLSLVGMLGMRGIMMLIGVYVSCFISVNGAAGFD